MNNHRPSSSAALERQLAERLRQLLGTSQDFGKWEVTQNPSASQRAFDIEATTRLPQGPRIELWVECKAEPRPVHFPYVNLTQRSQAMKPSLIRVPVLAAPVIGPRMAEVCQQHGWSWFDLAGNCRLSVPGRLHIERHGLKSVQREPKAGANLGTPEASRVLRAMLLPKPNVSFWTQRDLQDRCRPGVSIGLVNKVLSHLRAEKFVEKDTKGLYQVRDASGLLGAWRQAYQFHRVQQVRLFSLKRPAEIAKTLQDLRPPGDVMVSYAAFSAADIQAPAVRQPKTWLMVSAGKVEKVIAALAAKEVDSGDNLVLLVPPDDGPFYEPEQRAGNLPCTNPLQTYLDVSHLAGRGEEAAEAILNQVIKPAWKTQGLS